MNALVSEVDRCISECCDSPCFAAIQDSIIYSYTDETLDVYWYYKVQGQDSVLMFNMAEYKKITRNYIFSKTLQPMQACWIGKL